MSQFNPGDIVRANSHPGYYTIIKHVPNQLWLNRETYEVRLTHNSMGKPYKKVFKTKELSWLYPAKEHLIKKQQRLLNAVIDIDNLLRQIG